MKRLLISLAIIVSCSKSNPTQISWNAIDYTIENYTNYNQYMDKPYISLTFPNILSQIYEIGYYKGIMKIDKADYIFMAHNWGEQEIEIILYSDNKEVSRTKLKPEYPQNRKDTDIATFSFNFPKQKGRYTIEILLTSSNQTLYKNILYDSSNTLQLI